MGYDDSEYLQILNLYSLLLEALREQPPSDESSIDGLWLAVKLFLHASTANWLSHGTEVGSVLCKPGAEILDWPSVTVLARASLECFLAYYYVFVDPQMDQDQHEFRYAAWKLNGFALREKFPAQLRQSQVKQAEEAQLCTALRSEIKQTQRFQSLCPQRKKAVLAGRTWRLAGWAEIARSAQIGQQYARFLYGYQCEYAHPGSLSALQIAQAKSTEDQRMLMHGALCSIMVAVSKMIIVLAQTFPQAQRVLGEQPEAAQLARIYVEAASRAE